MFGSIRDNAGGIAEMSGMEDEIRVLTDATSNTTTEIGKDFAIGSVAFVSQFAHVDMLHAFVDAMIPYWFSAMTMGAVGRAAH